MTASPGTSLRVVDSHTAGEPTRVIIEGGPDLGSVPLAVQRDRLRDHHDDLRRAVILEPRGSDALVGALLCRTPNEACTAGVIFFNNVGYIGMCGHGAIGLAVTLAHVGRIGLGALRLDTPVGSVAVDLTGPNEATVENVESYCWRRDVAVEVEGLGTVRGDVAWGGNWFFLVEQVQMPMDLEHEAALTDTARRIRAALASERITGADGAEIDHIELFGPPRAAHADSRNFVLCPGEAYDRSPCGTGTSAKLACLAARGLLAPGEAWVQESVIGSHFTARYRRSGSGRIVPSISGQAFVCAEATLIRHAADPFRDGIASGTTRQPAPPKPRRPGRPARFAPMDRGQAD